MPDASLGLLLLIIALALGFGVVNGFNDAANAIATVIGTRVLSPRNAIIMAAFLNLAGAATGTAVAITIGKGILAPEVISEFSIGRGILDYFSYLLWFAGKHKPRLYCWTSCRRDGSGWYWGGDVGVGFPFNTDPAGSGDSSLAGLCRRLCADAYSILAVPAKCPS